MSQTKTANRRSLGWLAAAGVFFATKLKWLFAILKLAKFSTLISLFISLGAYATFYGWKFAVGLIYLLFVHEMGHLVCARKKGIKTSPAVFIPFMGAVIGMKEKPKNAKDESFIAYGGPLAGLISILPALFLYAVTHDEFWSLIILLGAILNLFNLIPISPLDGGRILSVVSPKIWFLGLIIIGVYTFIQFNPILIIILIAGIASLLDRNKQIRQLEIDRYELEKEKALSGRIDGLAYKLDYTDSWQYSLNTELHENERRIQSHQTEPISWYDLKKRTKRKKQEIDHQINHIYSQVLRGLFHATDEEHSNQMFTDMKEQLNLKIQKLTKSIHDRESYYRASLKEKALALVLYVGLAIILTGIWWYGESMLSISDII